MEQVTGERVKKRDPLANFCIQRYRELLAVDEEPCDVIKHSEDGPYKYRNAWFAQVMLITEAALIEILNVDDFPNQESDNAYKKRLKKHRRDSETSSKHTGNKDITEKEFIDKNAPKPEFPKVYGKIIKEGVEVDDIKEVFEYWNEIRGSRINYREDVEVGKRIVERVIEMLTT